MIAAIEAIYEDGLLRPLQSIALPEHTHVRISLKTTDEDPERASFLGESARRLRETWDNDADDAYNALLA
jgi:predicted DNA-binding antitoxin AbrB/MazE fold protein